MSKVNPLTLNKKYQKIYFEGRCRHRHTYAEHPNCFIDEVFNGYKREGFLDIETTGFQADYHHMLTYVIKVRGEKTYYKGCINKEDLESGTFDKRLCEKIISDLSNFDVIYTYYGARFDIPFIRSRCLKWGLEFPLFGILQHKDIFYMVRNKLKLHRNSLEAATRFLGIAGKNHVDGDIWMKARIGDKKALKYVMDHNIPDVDILEELLDKIQGYVKRSTKST